MIRASKTPTAKRPRSPNAAVAAAPSTTKRPCNGGRLVITDPNMGQTQLAAAQLRKRPHQKTFKVPCCCPEYTSNGGSCTQHDKGTIPLDKFLPSDDLDAICQLLDKETELPFVPIGLEGDELLLEFMTDLFVELKHMVMDDDVTTNKLMFTGNRHLKVQFSICKEQYLTRIPPLMERAIIAAKSRINQSRAIDPEWKGVVQSSISGIVGVVGDLAGVQKTTIGRVDKLESAQQMTNQSVHNLLQSQKLTVERTDNLEAKQTTLQTNQKTSDRTLMRTVERTGRLEQQHSTLQDEMESLKRRVFGNDFVQPSSSTAASTSAGGAAVVVEPTPLKPAASVVSVVPASQPVPFTPMAPSRAPESSMSSEGLTWAPSSSWASSLNAAGEYETLKTTSISSTWTASLKTAPVPSDILESTATSVAPLASAPPGQKSKPEKLNKWGHTKAEVKDIRQYINPAFNGYQEYLRSEKACSDAVKAFIPRLISALQKLPNHTGQVLRGAAHSDEFIAEYLQVGKTFVDPAFMSSTKASELPNSFKNMRVHFIIQSKTGKSIVMYAPKSYKHEDEVVFFPSTPFLITSSKVASDPEHWEVEMTEV